MHTDTLSRLKKIEGQVRGIIRMIEEEKYCIDIVNQISAVKGGLDKVSLMILKNHMNSCLTYAIKKSDHAEEKIDEVIKTIERALK